MKVKIDPAVFKEFNPKLKIAFILVENIDNKKNLEEAKHLLNEIEELVRLTFFKDSVKSHNLISSWVAAQKAFGAGARHYHTSVEKLIHKVLQKKSIVQKDTLSNVINYLALKYVAPFGVDDLSEVEGDITFKVATKNKRVGLLKGLKKGELYYQDDKRILGKKLSHWKAPKTKVVPETYFALIHFEALPPVTTSEFNKLLTEARRLIKYILNAKTKVFVLDKKKKIMGI